MLKEGEVKGRSSHTPRLSLALHRLNILLQSFSLANTYSFTPSDFSLYATSLPGPPDR